MGVVATRYSFEFIRAHLPEGARRVLEVGCGNGELAAMLKKDGMDVIALDSEETCVTTARAAGVDARLMSWPAELDDAFDAVLFTRSLHHIAPLKEAVTAAVAALRHGGKIIVEDFRIESESPRTDAWFTGLVRLLDAGKLFPHGFNLATILEKLDFGEHRHELHSSIAMAEALARHGDLVEEDAAYYFRYAEPEVDEQVATAILEFELMMTAAGAIDALGKRFVLTLTS